MKIKIKKVYYCNYCKKYYLKSDSCLNHEKVCYHNPDNKKACFDCYCAEMIKVVYGINEGCWNERELKSQCFKCNKTEQLYYHPNFERTDAFKLNGAPEDQIEMPLNCQYRKLIGAVD